MNKYCIYRSSLIEICILEINKYPSYVSYLLINGKLYIKDIFGYKNGFKIFNTKESQCCDQLKIIKAIKKIEKEQLLTIFVNP